MKGKLNTGISISNNETLLAGTEVEIVDSLNGYTGVVYQCRLPILSDQEIDDLIDSILEEEKQS